MYIVNSVYSIQIERGFGNDISKWEVKWSNEIMVRAQILIKIKHAWAGLAPG